MAPSSCPTLERNRQQALEIDLMDQFKINVNKLLNYVAIKAPFTK